MRRIYIMALEYLILGHSIVRQLKIFHAYITYYIRNHQHSSYVRYINRYATMFNETTVRQLYTFSRQLVTVENS